MLAQLLYADERPLEERFSFVAEWECHYAHGKFSKFLCYLGYYRGGASSGTSAHSGGDEDHLALVREHLLYLVCALYSCASALFRVASGSKPLVAQIKFVDNAVVVKRLPVCIAYYKFYILNTLPVHGIHGIAPASANSYNLYQRFRAGNPVFRNYYVVVFHIQA